LAGAVVPNAIVPAEEYGTKVRSTLHSGAAQYSFQFLQKAEASSTGEDKCCFSARESPSDPAIGKNITCLR
jgi:hypothetical protein